MSLVACQHAPVGSFNHAASKYLSLNARALILPRHQRATASGFRQRQRHGRTIDTSTAGIRRSPVIAPGITYGKGEEEVSMGLYQYLLRQRIIFLGGFVTDKVATQVVGSLMALEAMDENEDIRIYINSSGGQPYSVFGILDAIQSIKPEVQTVGLGACYSYASLILAAGTPGKRFAMKNTRIMMTQPNGGSQGDMYAVAATVCELNALYQMAARYYQSYTGMSADDVERATSRDYFMTPEEAVQQGLIDDIIRGAGDYTVPPAIRRQMRQAGLSDDLTPDLFQAFML